MILVVMGVSGCGKTTVGTKLATELCWSFADADDFHSEENKKKMASGSPLSDEDRMPWLISLHDEIDRWTRNGENAVVTCSALKRFYRDVLVFGTTDINATKEETTPCREDAAWEKDVRCENKGGILNSDQPESQKCCHNLKHSLVFVFLQASPEVLAQRLAERCGHFMPQTLLQSQLDTLEVPQHPEQFIEVDANKSVSEIVRQCLVADTVTKYLCNGQT